MGRKIPGKKHRGTKDPVLQKAARDARVAHVINAPPELPDEQKVPRSLIRVMELKRLAKERGGSVRERKRKGCHAQGQSDAVEMAETGRGCGVSKRDLHRRQLRELTLKVKEKIIQAEYETRLGVKLVKNREGELVPKKSLKNQNAIVDGIVRRKKQVKKIPTRSEGGGGVVKKTTEVRAGKKEDKEHYRKASGSKRLKKLKDSDEWNMIARDQVQFREVVHEPPTLVTPKYRANGRNVDIAVGKPGHKELLLKRLLNGHVKTNAPHHSNTHAKTQQHLEAERRKMVELYRSLKMQRKLL